MSVTPDPQIAAANAARKEQEDIEHDDIDSDWLDAMAISDPSFQGAEMTFEGVGLRPFAPCQLRAVWNSSGADLTLAWIRRDRSPSADSWEQTEIPQSEASESYDLEILDVSGNVVRTFSGVSAPNQTYAATQMSADFPFGMPSPFRFTVYQLSAVFGRGPGKTASCYFS